MTASAPPQLTDRFDAALALARETHGRERRSGTCIPFMAHLLVVTGLVFEDGGDEDEAIAAMLHDSVEDGGGAAMLERIERTFGAHVAEIVAGCSDNLDGGDGEPWVERKRRYLDHLARTDDAAILRVSLADKVHNAASIVRELRTDPDALFQRAPEKSAEDRVWYYGRLLELFSARRPGPLTEDLRRAVAEMRDLAAPGQA
jgi:(p)ppGpp synthase/HD superfamily hydrolase